MKLKESDWKVFKARVPEWRERYLSEKNKEACSMLGDASLSPTEAFWNTFQFLQTESKTLRGCFDNYSRSKVLFSLLEMLAHGVISEADLEGFSSELQERISGIIHDTW